MVVTSECSVQASSVVKVGGVLCKALSDMAKVIFSFRAMEPARSRQLGQRVGARAAAGASRVVHTGARCEMRDGCRAGALRLAGGAAVMRDGSWYLVVYNIVICQHTTTGAPTKTDLAGGRIRPPPPCKRGPGPIPISRLSARVTT